MALAHSFKANPHWLPRQKKRAVAAIPGEDGLPFIGNTLRMLRDPMAFGHHMVSTYGRVFRNHAFGGPTVSLMGPEANELVLFDREKLFSSEQGWGPMLNLLFPRGLMLMDFEKHRADRKVMAVAFKPEPMRHYAEALNSGIARTVSRLGRQADALLRRDQGADARSRRRQLPRHAARPRGGPDQPGVRRRGPGIGDAGARAACRARKCARA